MTAFLDGPAKGQTLMLKRAAKFLRVVQEESHLFPGDGKFDALDQLEDSPAANEHIYVYEIHGQVTMCHINRGRNGSGFYPMAEYRFVEQQPSDEVMRSNEYWSAWCKEKAGL